LAFDAAAALSACRFWHKAPFLPSVLRALRSDRNKALVQSLNPAEEPQPYCGIDQRSDERIAVIRHFHASG
jgi:hypothetical protein